jgi:drug/metabolite transporter (DMT)-like permease
MFKKIPGTLSTLFAFLCFALGGLLIKLIPWNSLAINCARNFIAFFVMLIYMKAIGHKIVFNKHVFVGACCLFATIALYAMANKLTTAANTIILQFTNPIFVILLTWLLFKKKPRRMDVAACFFVFCGVVFFFVDGVSAGNMLGNVLALISGFTFAGVMLINSYPDSDPLSSVLLGMAAGFFMGLPFLIKQDLSAGGAGAWTALLALGIFQLGFAYIFFTEGIKTTPPIAASLMGGIEAVLNPTLVAIFYHELISPLSMVGAVIVFISVMVYNVIDTVKRQKHKAA